MTRLLASVCALALLAASPAFAGPPTTIVSAPNQSLVSNVLTLTATGACPAGSMALAVFADYNGNNTTTMTDSRGNTWTSDTWTWGSANTAGVIWRSSLTAGLQVGDTLTVNFSATTAAYAVVDCIGASVTSDPTGKGGAGGSYTGTNVTVTDSGSPPTNAARVFFATFMPSQFDQFTTSGGWTLADSAMNGTGIGIKVYYQDVAPGATSTQTYTNNTSANGQWTSLWHSFSIPAGGGPTVQSQPMTLLGVQ